MKRLITLCFTGCMLTAANSNAQQLGVSTDALVGMGQSCMAQTVPLHGGLAFGLFYTMKNSPISFGYRFSNNYYSSSTQKEVPFFRDNYVHDVANITNNHSIGQHLLFARLEPFKNAAISPFIEGGAGYARYVTRWSASDPYENTNNNCQGYSDQGTFYRDGTWVMNGTAGVNIKFNKLSGKNNCAGTWLVLAVDYSQGGKVSYLNSKLNSNQFYYNMGDPATAGTKVDPRTMSAMSGMQHDQGTTTASSTSNTSSCHLGYDLPSFTAKHELVQFRVGVVFVLGNCK